MFKCVFCLIDYNYILSVTVSVCHNYSFKKKNLFCTINSPVLNTGINKNGSTIGILGVW